LTVIPLSQISLSIREKLPRFDEFVNCFSFFFTVFACFSHFIFQILNCQKVWVLTVGCFGFGICGRMPVKIFFSYVRRFEDEEI